MSLILDIAVIIAFAAFLLIGIKNGFVKELISLISFVLAAIITFAVANWVAPLIYDGFLSNFVENSIQKAIASSVGNDVESIALVIPEAFVNAAKSFNIDLNEIIFGNIGETIQQTAEAVANAINLNIARPLIIGILNIILFIILFVLLKLIIKWIGSILNFISKIPILKSVNKLLGGILGGIKGIVLICIVCYLITLIIGFTSDGVFGITDSVIANTKVFKMFLNQRI